MKVEQCVPNLEEVWNGRFTDNENDIWQKLALEATSWFSFEYKCKQIIEEANDEQ